MAETEYVDVGGKRVRIYNIGDKRYPSVTSILQYLPEGFGLRRWRDKNPNWRELLDKAASRGTVAHWRIATYLAKEYGLPLEPLELRKKYPLDHDDIEKIGATYAHFQDFLASHTVKPIRLEFTLHSDKWEFAGTGDGIVQMDELDGLVLWDIKTSKRFYEKHGAQLWAYKQAVEETMPYEIERCGVLKINETGWKWIDVDVEKYADLFLDALDIYNEVTGRKTPCV